MEEEQQLLPPLPPLTAEEVQSFVAEGFLVKRGVLDPRRCAQARDRLWAGNTSASLRREDPRTWSAGFAEADRQSTLDGLNDRTGAGGRNWRLRELVRTKAPPLPCVSTVFLSKTVPFRAVPLDQGGDAELIALLPQVRSTARLSFFPRASTRIVLFLRQSLSSPSVCPSLPQRVWPWLEQLLGAGEVVAPRVTATAADPDPRGKVSKALSFCCVSTVFQSKTLPSLAVSLTRAPAAAGLAGLGREGKHGRYCRC
eukprot:SAG22_NODE_2181_length_2877_cov_2.137509_2_plen_255_part_00